MGLDGDIVLVRLPAADTEMKEKSSLYKHVFRHINGMRTIQDLESELGEAVSNAIGEDTSQIICQLIADKKIAAKASLDNPFKKLADHQQCMANLAIVHLGVSNAERLLKILSDMDDGKENRSLAVKKIGKLVRLTIDEQKAVQLTDSFNAYSEAV